MRKLIFAAVILGGIVLLSVPLIDGCRTRSTAKKLADLERFLTHTDAETREWAAGELLDADPSRSGELRVVQSEALLELGRVDQARSILELIGDDQEESIRRKAIELEITSYFSDVSWVLGRADPENADRVQERVEELLSKAIACSENLKGFSDTEHLTLKIRARDAEARTRLVRLKLVGPERVYAKAIAAGVKKEIEQIGEQVEELRSETRKAENRLVLFCEQVIESHPEDLEPLEMLFSMWLDSGIYVQARRVAKRLYEHENIDAAMVGRFAGALLDLERRYSALVTEDDIEVARLLLSHKNLGEKVPLELEMARIHLTLIEGDPVQAEQLAIDLLEKYPLHPRGMYLLAWAMCDQGRADKAVEVLSLYYQNARSSEVLHVFGRAMIGIGEERRGRELILQSLDIRPKNLPARLLLAEYLVEKGQVLEAERDIREAMRLNPSHPRVRGLYARYLVEKLDREAIRKLMQSYAEDAEAGIGWRDAAIAAAMVLDDRYTVGRLCEGQAGLIVEFANGWIGAPRVKRFETGVVVARVLLNVIDRPMDRLPINTFVGEGETDIREPHQSLKRCLYVPWPTETALELVAAALLRWPDEPWLLDMSARLWLWNGMEQVAQVRLDRLRLQGSEASVIARLMRGYIEGDQGVVLEKHVGAGVWGGRMGDATVGWVLLAAAIREGDMDRVDSVLKRMLMDHHWPEQALLMAVSDAFEAEQMERAGRYLDMAEKYNPPLGQLVLSRYRLAQDRPMDAVVESRILTRGEPDTSELRFMVSEILGRANASIGHVEIAVGMFENLATAAHHLRVQIRLATVNLLLNAGRDSTATFVIESMMTEKQLSSRELDLLLRKAIVVLDPDRFAEHLDQRIADHGDDQVLLFYRGMYLSRAGKYSEAEAVFRELLDQRPQAVRALVELAAAVEHQGRVVEAREIFERLSREGGLAGVMASDRLQRLGGVLEPAG